MSKITSSRALAAGLQSKCFLTGTQIDRCIALAVAEHEAMLRFSCRSRASADEAKTCNRIKPSLPKQQGKGFTNIGRLLSTKNRNHLSSTKAQRRNVMIIPVKETFDSKTNRFS
jgi:hypothetical protein